MQIKDVMEETQLSKKAIRYYENCGLIETSRKANGYKDYSDESVHKLASVKKFRELGFSTEEIKEFYESEAKRQVVLTETMKNNEKLISTQNKIKAFVPVKTYLYASNGTWGRGAKTFLSAVNKS